MNRKENWPTLLSAFLKSRQAMPFEWGKNDCLLFCGDVIFELTGNDYRTRFLGHYDDEAGAQVFVDEAGGVEGIISEFLGRGSTQIGKAMRGDIVLMSVVGVKMAGVIDDSGHKAVGLTDKGLVRVPMKNCLKYWSY